MPEQQKRPDLSSGHILLLLAVLGIAAAIIGLWPGLPAPGSGFGQLSAAAGALLLLAPLSYVVLKRSGVAVSPPTWFVVHVVAAQIGCCLILIHVAAGDWFSPPGLILLLLLFLIAQGSLLRAFFSRGYSLLFARSNAAQGFAPPQALDKNALQALIDAKQDLLKHLDGEADEALFSPALRHWLHHPIKSLRYQRMATREADMIGARAAAGIKLSWSRRIHMLAALGFYLGLILHLVVVLFFAGYAADGGAIDWWYITDWGKHW